MHNRKPPGKRCPLPRRKASLPMNSRHPHRRRTAFSLLEVIIATGILSASAILLLSLFSTGDRMSRRAERRVRAQMHCQAQLAQLLANPQGARVVDGEPIDGFPNWIWSLQLQPTPFAGLVAATVRVSELPA